MILYEKMHFQKYRGRPSKNMLKIKMPISCEKIIKTVFFQITVELTACQNKHMEYENLLTGPISVLFNLQNI